MHSNNSILNLNKEEMNGHKDLTLSNGSNKEGKANSLIPCKRKIKPLKPLVLLRKNSGVGVYPVACKHFKTKETVISIKPKQDNTYSSCKISTKTRSEYNHINSLAVLEQQFDSNNKRMKNNPISKLDDVRSSKKYVTKSSSFTGKTKMKNVNVSIMYPSKSYGFKPKLFNGMKRNSFGSTFPEAPNESTLQKTKLARLNKCRGHPVPAVQQAFSTISTPMTSNALSNPCEPLRQSEPAHQNSDDSLTNITWLGQMGINHFMPIPLERTMKYYKIADKCKRPPYSYMVLIQFAINSSYEKRMTLKEIYQWIEETFPYFKSAKPGWKNSIRHNLSLHDIFVREISSSAKSSYWTLKEDISGVGPSSFFKLSSYQTTSVPIQSLKESCISQSSSPLPLTLRPNPQYVQNGKSLSVGKDTLTPTGMKTKPQTPGPRRSYDEAFPIPINFQQERAGSVLSGDEENALIRGKFNSDEMGPMLCDSSVNNTKMNSTGISKQTSDLHLIPFEKLRDECSWSLSTVRQECSTEISQSIYDTAPITNENMSKLLDDFDSPLKSLFFTSVDSSASRRLEKYRGKSDRPTYTKVRTNKKTTVYRNFLSSKTSEVVMFGNGSGDSLSCFSQQVIGNNTAGRLFPTNPTSCYNQAFARPQSEDGISKQRPLFETIENREPFSREGKLTFCDASGDGMMSRRSVKSINGSLQNITSPILNNSNDHLRSAQNCSTTATSSKPAILPHKTSTCDDATFSMDSSSAAYERPLGDNDNDNKFILPLPNGFNCGSSEPLDTSFSKLLDLSGCHSSLECHFPDSLQDSDDLHWPVL